MKETIAIGAHRIWVEGDVARVLLQGLVTKAELSKVLEQLERAHREAGADYIIYDATRVLPLEIEVRKWAAKEFPELKYRVTCVYGASAVIRITITAIQSAAAALGRIPKMPLKMVKSEKEALTLIGEDRSKRRKGG